MGRLDINKIEQRLDHDCGKITVFDSIDSTSSWLLENGACGDVCLSEAQTGGRGRRGNQWLSPDAGNIYFSMCWCFKERTEHWPLLGLIVGIAIADTLKELGLQQHGVKWPNDIFWRDRKLGGILLESREPSGRLVMGIGLNINMQEKPQQLISQHISQPWVSLHEALDGQLLSRNQIVAKMMNQLQARLSRFAEFNLDDFLTEWTKWDVLSGKTVNIRQNRNEIPGSVTGIDKQGRIGVLLEDQAIHYFSSAEIKLVAE